MARKRKVKKASKKSSFSLTFPRGPLQRGSRSDQLLNVTPFSNTNGCEVLLIEPLRFDKGEVETLGLEGPKQLPQTQRLEPRGQGQLRLRGDAPVNHFEIHFLEVVEKEEKEEKNDEKEGWFLVKKRFFV